MCRFRHNSNLTQLDANVKFHSEPEGSIELGFTLSRRDRGGEGGGVLGLENFDAPLKMGNLAMQDPKFPKLNII